MPRWEPNTSERLRAAAMELFEKHGFDGVTVEDIARRAGMNRRSFFRYFADKREVLFAGSDSLGEFVVAAVIAVPDGDPETACQAMFAALADIGSAILADRPAQRRRRAVIVSSADLRERERAKLTATADAITKALLAKDVAHARLVAAIAVALFYEAFEQALEDDADAPFRERMARVRADTAHVL